MELRTLRGTGAKVSPICLGTMTFGQQVDEAEADRILGVSMDAGVNFIDTADVYVNGVSETITGNILKGKRDQLPVGHPSLMVSINYLAQCYEEIGRSLEAAA